MPSSVYEHDLRVDEYDLKQRDPLYAKPIPFSPLDMEVRRKETLWWLHAEYERNGRFFDNPPEPRYKIPPGVRATPEEYLKFHMRVHLDFCRERGDDPETCNYWDCLWFHTEAIFLLKDYPHLDPKCNPSTYKQHLELLE
jgi:hypothetical protein